MQDSLEPTSRPEDQPPASVELDAMRLLVEAYIEVEGPTKGRAFLLAAARIMSRREKVASVLVEFAPPKESAERAKVRRQTTAWFRRSLPVWLERLEDRADD